MPRRVCGRFGASVVRRASAGLLLATLGGGCATLIAAARDQTVQRDRLGRIEGTLTSLDGADGPIFVVALEERDGDLARLHTYTRLSGPGPYSFHVDVGSYVVGAFRDVDGDAHFDPAEPAAVHDEWRPIAVDANEPARVDLELLAPLTDAPTTIERRSGYFRSGEVVPLSAARFAREVGDLAEWQPYRFMREYGAGIFLLEPYDRARVPVVLVHGMGGYPQEFDALIAHLDRARYQVWVAQYPSGWALSEVSAYFYRELGQLTSELAVERLCIEAHSMGGLVARAALGLYAADRSRSADYVVQFMTIASPLGGHPSAATGVSMSPVVIPAWRDLSPRSGFIAELFYAPLPASVHYDLVYAFDHGDGDGVVPIRSQLREDAQREAADQRGFDLGHAEILRSEDSLAYIVERIDTSCR